MNRSEQIAEREQEIVAALVDIYRHFDCPTDEAESLSTKASERYRASAVDNARDYWQGAYERMAARNVRLSSALKTAAEALDDLAHGHGLSRPIEQIIRDLNDARTTA